MIDISSFGFTFRAAQQAIARDWTTALQAAP
jgi:hypothetical protein